ncbi:hypothetical protein GCWU000324_00763 [Kingella oralis ATCC 51147]|uniref:Uncharacterized protein n=1 Tax=Kingella oralis ATCC 51147 TaxID=629741 RepID=C4GF49_9NEIS|nr:hypothetical protein GCWU000324_00763 [Kingella oralis ATCC 51147]
MNRQPENQNKTTTAHLPNRYPQGSLKTNAAISAKPQPIHPNHPQPPCPKKPPSANASPVFSNS